jgi:mannitol/fructose-specific phosphotransferase system IIA component (Ntr-type)/predicted RNA-binding Zn-ribbon protein involved in translation (DUF1610 family)
LGTRKKLTSAKGSTSNSSHRVIHTLIQLQELSVARAQQEAADGGSRLTQLDEAISSLMGDLPDIVAVQFRKLTTKGLLAIVPISNQACTACGMVLPKSFIQAVRLEETLFPCPNCARIVYLPQVDIRSQGKRPRRGAAPKVGVQRFSGPDLMIHKLSGTTPEEVLGQLTDKLESEGYIQDTKNVLEMALNRESMSSTAVDHALAFPHVRGVEGGGLTLTLGIHRKGIKFDPSSRKLTRVFFFMVIPTAASVFYLKLLAGLTQAFRKTENREKLLEAKSEEDLWKALVKCTKSTVK